MKVSEATYSVDVREESLQIIWEIKSSVTQDWGSEDLKEARDAVNTSWESGHLGFPPSSAVGPCHVRSLLWTSL